MKLSDYKIRKSITLQVLTQLITDQRSTPDRRLNRTAKLDYKIVRTAKQDRQTGPENCTI